jgi:hypothetical protein
MKANSARKSSVLVVALVLWLGLASSPAGDPIVQTGPARKPPSDKGFFTVPDSQMVWGESTNFLRADPAGTTKATELRVGIRCTNNAMVLSLKPFKVVQSASVYLNSRLGRPVWDYPVTTNDGVPTQLVTNPVDFLFLPPENDRFVIGVTDSSGQPVPKTAQGRELGQSPLGGRIFWRNWGKYGCKGCGLMPWADDELYALDPTKYFAIEKSGVYKLTLVQRLYMVDTNAYLKAITLPPVTLDVKVEDAIIR